MLILWRRGGSCSTLSHLNRTLFVHQEYGSAQLENDHWVADLSQEPKIAPPKVLVHRACGHALLESDHIYHADRQFPAIVITLQDNNEANGSRDPANTSGRIWTSRMNKMLKRMVKKRTSTIKAFQASKVACPPLQAFGHVRLENDKRGKKKYTAKVTWRFSRRQTMKPLLPRSVWDRVCIRNFVRMKHFTFVQTRDVDNVTVDYDQELHDYKKTRESFYQE